MFICGKMFEMRGQKQPRSVGSSSTDLLLKEFHLEDIKLGDLVEFKRYYGLYSHWGVYVGNGNVIHRSREPCGRTYDVKDILSLREIVIWFDNPDTKVKVMKNRIDEIIGNGSVRVHNEFDPPGEDSVTPFSEDEILRRAHDKLGEISQFDLASNNCEHFVSEVRYGVHRSTQLKLVGARLTLALQKVTNVIAIYVNYFPPKVLPSILITVVNFLFIYIFVFK